MRNDLVTAPRVSVIMPAYNHERFVAAAVQSVLNQTLREFEFIIVDDGSTDATPQIIASFTDDRIRFERLDQTTGGAAAMNRCIRMARCEYIALINSDDEFLPDKLKIQLKTLETRPDIAAVFSNAELIDEHGLPPAGEHFYNGLFRQSNRTRAEWLHTFFYVGNCLCHPSMMIRKSCYETLGMLDERLSKLPDMHMWVRLCANFDILVLDEPLVRFRLLNGQMNHSGSRPETHIMIQHELTLVLDEYLKLDDALHAQLFGRAENIYIKWFAVYMAALGLSAPGAKRWAMGGLYALMGEAGGRAALERAGFYLTDLYALASRDDIYALYRRSKLYYDIGNGFEEAQCVSAPLDLSRRAFLQRFILPAGAFRLRYDPCEGSLASLRLDFARTDGKAAAFVHNGRNVGSSIIFDTPDPMLIFDTGASVFEIQGRLELLPPVPDAAHSAMLLASSRALFARLAASLEHCARLTTKLEQTKNALDELFASRAFRFFRFFFRR
jgi:glycosyltransferase involved in cell wall biosynthesis